MRSSWLLPGLGLVALGATLVGCRSSTPPSSCSRNSDCPDGWSCVLAACVAPAADGSVDAYRGMRPDAGPIDAAEFEIPDQDLCGQQGIPINPVLPKVLLIVDRSCSMRASLETGQEGTAADHDTRWAYARDALRELVQDYGNRARWALMLYPDEGAACGEPEFYLRFPTANATNASTVRSALASPNTSPFTVCGGTPTLQALLSAQTSRATHVILVTDGAATCDTTAEQLAAATIRLRALGMEVAAVGFSSGGTTGEAATMLDAIGREGGLAPSGSANAFYAAETPAALSEAFRSIIRSTISCTYEIDAGRIDLGQEMFVAQNGVVVDPSDTDGYVFDESTASITFTGSYCERILDGQVSRIGVAYGCPTPVCTPATEVCDGIDNDCDGDVDEDCPVD